MRNKFTLKEGEIQRILGLHKQVFLKENGQNILKEESTVTIEDTLTFDPSSKNESEDELQIYKGTKFKVSTKIKNSLVTTRKVSAQFPSAASGGCSASFKDNKAYVVYNCNTKNVYLVGSTNEGAKEQKDFNPSKSIWKTEGKMTSCDTLCSEASNVVKNNEGSSNLGGDYKQLRLQDFTPMPGGKNKGSFTTPIDSVWKKAGDKGAITKKPGWDNIGFLCAGYLSPKNVAYNFMYDKTWYTNKAFWSFLKNKFCGTKTETDDDKVDGTSELDPKVNPKVKGNRYTFDFDTIMKAIDDTGKCAGSRGSSDGTNGTNGTQGTSGTNGTNGTNGIQNPVPINNKISKDLYYKIIAP